MSSYFLNLGALIWLWIIPVIILFYFLKLKREKQFFPSTMLWRNMLQDMQVNSPFQRLKNNLLLVLQLLLAILLILAITRPFWAKEIKQGRNIIVLLDNSASMQTIEESGKTRFQLAKDIIEKIINDLGTGDRMILASFGSQVLTHTAFTESKKDLYEVLNQITPKHSITNIQDAFILANTLTTHLTNPKIYIVSDSAIPNLSDTIKNFYQGHPQRILPEFILVGQRQNNVAIVSLEAKRLSLSNSTQIFCRIQNFGEEEVQGLLQLKIDDVLLEGETKGLTLKPGDIQGIVWPNLQIQQGNILLHFQPTVGDDYLELDNYAYYALGNWAKPKVLVCVQNSFLKKALAVQKIDIDYVQPSQLITKLNAFEYDIVILEDWNSLETLPPGNYFCFNSLPALANLQILGTLKAPSGKRLEISDQKDDHPTMQFVELRKINIVEAMELRWPENTISLLEAENHIIMGYFNKENSQFLLVAYNLQNSDWPLEISFPIFIHNTISWFMEQRYQYHQQISTPFVLPLSRHVQQATMKNPDDKKILLQRPKFGQWMYGQNDLLGFYHLEYDSTFPPIILSSFLGSPEESCIKPAQEIKVGEKTLTQDSTAILNRELWPFFVIMALVVMLLEWYWFHRRSLSIWQFLPKKKLDI